MSVAGVLVRRNPASPPVERVGAIDRPSHFARVAQGGVMALVLAAPFEATNPILRRPGQSVTTVETVMLAVFAMCAVAALRGRTWPRLPGRDLWPWALFVAAAWASALSAPEFRTNAVHMAARVAMAAAVYVLCLAGTGSASAARRIAVTIVSAAVLASSLVLADYFGGPGAGRLLAPFRDGVAVVGAQVRASGPFQYPTIASMYLEIAFAVGLGLLASMHRAAAWQLGVAVAMLGLVAEAVVLTFTRSGLITILCSFAIVGTLHWRRHGTDRAIVALVGLGAIVCLALASSHSAESLMLRMTTEGQGRWYSATIEAPRSVTIDTGRAIGVPLTLTNTGRATWDSYASEPTTLSYHWIGSDSDEVIAWEGIRTRFEAPVRPGQTVSIVALVDAPTGPGLFRLMWDIEQEDRLWFSTEPGAELVLTPATVTGTGAPVISERRGPRRVPGAAVRPGRLVLWGAAFRMWLERPFLGVGPDNFRLLYGRFALVRTADPRVHSNNLYVEVLAGMGLAGGAGLLWIGLRAGRAATLRARECGVGPGIAAACAAIGVHGLADSFLSFTGTYILMAVVLGLASSSERTDGRHAHRV